MAYGPFSYYPAPVYTVNVDCLKQGGLPTSTWYSYINFKVVSDLSKTDTTYQSAHAFAQNITHIHTQPHTRTHTHTHTLLIDTLLTHTHTYTHTHTHG